MTEQEIQQIIDATVAATMSAMAEAVWNTDISQYKANGSAADIIRRTVLHARNAELQAGRKR